MKLSFLLLLFFGILGADPIELNSTTTPNCTTPQKKLKLSTYGKNGSHPNNAAEFQTLINTYADETHRHGFGYIDNIYTPGYLNHDPYHANPDNYYLSIIEGYIYFPQTGIYKIGVNGDDAIEVYIDDTLITGWYGGHARARQAQKVVEVNATQGWHKIVFHHEEGGGGDDYYLYWQTPSQSRLSIIPASQLYHCPPVVNPVSPDCPTPVLGIGLSVYSKGGWHPDNAAQFQTLINTYANESHRYGSGYLDNIHTPSPADNNPYHSDPDDYYLSVIRGYIYFPQTGIYKIGIDGDDAVEVYINDTLITGWHGGHGAAGHAVRIVDMQASQGWYKIAFHQEDGGGSDNYYLYWQPPSGNTMDIIPASQYFHCTPTVTKSSCVINDPVNGTTNPKRIPGSTIRYAVEVHNKDEIVISDSIVSDTIDSAHFDTGTIANLRIGTSPCNCLSPGTTSPNGANGTGDGVSPVKLDFEDIAAHGKECGYFEVKVK